jgi:hypothetical protein
MGINLACLLEPSLLVNPQSLGTHTQQPDPVVHFWLVDVVRRRQGENPRTLLGLQNKTAKFQHWQSFAWLTGPRRCFWLPSALSDFQLDPSHGVFLADPRIDVGEYPT